MIHDELLTISQAAFFCNLSVQTLRNYEKKGILKADYKTFGGQRRYSKRLIEDFIRRQRTDAFKTDSNSIFD